MIFSADITYISLKHIDLCCCCSYVCSSSCPQTQLIEPMIVIPPRHYCTIADPVIIGQDGQPEVDKYGQTKLRFGDKEIRFHEDYKQPFWLYPGEKVCRCQITS